MPVLGRTVTGRKSLLLACLDGWATGANGSTVGYVHPPFAEQKIVHGGKQSMPLDHDNINSP